MADINIQTVEPGTRLSFEVYPTSIIGNTFENVKMKGIYDPTTARRFGADIESLHANIYPTLPQGSTDDDPYSYNYVEIEQPSGERKIIGVKWIKPESIKIQSTSRVTMVFEDMSPTNLERVRQSLSAIGVTPSSVKTDS